MVQIIIRQTRRTIQLLVTCGIVGSLLLLTTAPAAAQVEPASWIMYHQPQLATPKLEFHYPPKLVALWVQALQQGDLDLKRRAAAALAAAPPRGVPNLETAIPPLIQLLQDPDQPRVMRLTAAQALVALEARQAAEPLCACWMKRIWSWPRSWSRHWPGGPTKGQPLCGSSGWRNRRRFAALICWPSMAWPLWATSAPSRDYRTWRSIPTPPRDCGSQLPLPWDN